VIYLFAYAGSIVAANWLVQTFGLIPVGWGLMAPAGVLAAGVSFTLRDLVQDRMGRSWTVAAIGAGALLSLAVSDARFAVASGLAFLASETADMLVYSPLKRRTWLGAVFASNVVGLALDSALFLLLAFGSLDFLAGQIVGKLEMTVLTVAVLWLWRRRDLPVSDRAGAHA
jgi:uncharacterized PurR-regulated membrane protein YhhQ (DUF165 family)